MTALQAIPTITAAELLSHPLGKHSELVNGQILESQMSLEGAAVAGEICSTLRNHVKPNQLGIVMTSDASYQCFPDDVEKVRRPDVSFLRAGRITANQFSHGHCRVPPDLAVEIVSPNDLAFDVEKKVRDYLDCGVELVWVVYPEERFVRVDRADGTESKLEAHDHLTGESVIPGFQVKVADLFPSGDLYAKPVSQ